MQGTRQFTGKEICIVTQILKLLFTEKANAENVAV